MPKTLTYALMLAATLGLAACDKPGEEAAEDAQEARAEAQESMKDAAEEQNEAAEHEAEAARERAEENSNMNAPSTTAPGQPVSPPPTNQQ
ncbi:hypothetical protein ACX0MV_08905 [Pseudomonas borbori]